MRERGKFLNKNNRKLEARLYSIRILKSLTRESKDSQNGIELKWNLDRIIIA